MLEDSSFCNMKENMFREEKQLEFLQPGPQPGSPFVTKYV